MAISKEALAEIINGRAAQLCSEHANEIMDTMKTNAPNNEYFSGNYNFDSLYLNEDTSSSYQTQQNNNSNVNMNVAASIRESMMSNPIDVSSLNPEASVLDTLGVKSKPRQQQPRQMVTENITPKQTFTSAMNSGIDYSIFKAIVEECIDRKLNEHFSKQSLNENTLKTIGLAEGKIKLIDNKGNVYLSNLQYQGNIKDKKK